MEDKAKGVLRMGMAIVFISFGLMQFSAPDSWTGFIPQIIQNIAFNVFGLTAVNFVLANSFVEITLGLFLLLGIYTRFSSFILGLHLAFITVSIGFSATGVRDFGLTIATIVIFLNGADKICLDRKLN